MPSNFTENYNLSQWKKSDQVRMEDFNADNAKIDAALKAETDARAAADSAINAAISKLGNCQFYSYSYTGNGKFGESYPTVLQFPWKPVLAMILTQSGQLSMLVPDMTRLYSINANYGLNATNLSWRGNTLSLINVGSEASAAAQQNQNGWKYYVFAFRALN